MTDNFSENQIADEGQAIESDDCNSADWIKKGKKNLAFGFNCLSAKDRLVSKAVPLLALIPGVGLPLATAIGAGADMTSEVKQYLAQQFEHDKKVSPFAIVDIVADKANEHVPGVVKMFGSDPS